MGPERPGETRAPRSSAARWAITGEERTPRRAPHLVSVPAIRADIRKAPTCRVLARTGVSRRSCGVDAVTATIRGSDGFEPAPATTVAMAVTLRPGQNTDA